MLPDHPSTVTTQNNNRAGLDVRVGHVLGGSGVVLTIENNTQFGLFMLDGNAIVRTATIMNNGSPDVHLEFGARADLSGSTIAGTIDCDGTELLVGAVRSP